MSDLDLFSSQEGGSLFDAIRRDDEHGEFWWARDLMAALDYESWRNFEAAIERARDSADNSGSPDRQFVQVTQLVGSGNLGHQRRTDYRLTRYGAYLLVMNGDPRRKPKVADAQRYFATRTREAETATAAAPALPKSYAEALRELAETVERAEVERTGREVAEQRVTELAPAAAAWEQMVAEGGDHLVGDVAKVLQRAGIDTGPNRLYKTLRDLRWVYKAGDRGWRAMQRAVTNGWLVERLSTGTREHPTTGEQITNPPQVRVTAKGVGELHVRMSRSALELIVG